MIFPSYVRQKKRQKILLATILPVFLIILDRFFLTDSLLSTNIGIIALFLSGLLVYWALDFDLKINEAVHFLSPPILFLVVGYLTMVQIQNWFIYLLFLVLVAIGYYVMLLSLNVINVSTVRTVPLKKAAVSTLFFLGLIIFFFLGTKINSAGWGINPNVFWYWLAISWFGVNFLFLSADHVNFYFWESLLFALIALYLLILVNFWPAADLVTVVAVDGWLFIYLGIFYHHLNKSLKVNIVREYLLIGLVLFGIFILSA